MSNWQPSAVVDMDDLTHPPLAWEQQAGEPNRWYARFERFRLAGPNRSLLSTLNAERQQRGAKKGKSLPQAWARSVHQWRWRERAQAWDEYQRRQARAAHAQEIQGMNRRHAQEARALQNLAFQRLKSLDPNQLSATEVLRFCVESARLERTALGGLAAFEEQRSTGTGDVLFSLENAEADRELEEWNRDRLSTPGGPSLPQGDLQMP